MSGWAREHRRARARVGLGVRQWRGHARVPPPVILRHVAQRRVDSTLSRHRVRAGGEELRDAAADGTRVARQLRERRAAASARAAEPVERRRRRGNARGLVAVLGETDRGAEAGAASAHNDRVILVVHDSVCAATRQRATPRLAKREDAQAGLVEAAAAKPRELPVSRLAAFASWRRMSPAGEKQLPCDSRAVSLSRARARALVAAPTSWLRARRACACVRTCRCEKRSPEGIVTLSEILWQSQSCASRSLQEPATSTQRRLLFVLLSSPLRAPWASRTGSGVRRLRSKCGAGSAP